MISPEVMATSSSSAVSDSEAEVSDPSESSPSSGSAGGGARSKYSVMLGSPGYARLKRMQTWSFHLRESKDKSIPWWMG